MSEPPFLVKPKRLSTPAPSQLLSARQRAADDFFTHLDPATVVDALALPTGVLRSCLNGASATERDFAMRTAMASQRIWEWLNELSQWNWPTDSPSDGFEKPSATRRKLFLPVVTSAEEAAQKQYMGSLLADEVEEYGRRIEEIQRDMDELALEEIKRHVLHDYILPLSRPSTPMNLDPNRSMLSALTSYHKMEDISVLITAIVVQTLPNLARLTQLLQLWIMRLIVLRQVDPFLQPLEDAERFLGECWDTVAPSHSHWHMRRPARQVTARPDSTLTREEFEAKRRVLAQKVAQPGHALDYMLDCLEGSSDTLPDDWLNRMEDVEQGYSEWVATCERKISEAQWLKAVQSRPASRSPPLVKVRPSEEDNTSQSSGFQGAKLSNETIIPFREPNYGVFLDPTKKMNSSVSSLAPSGDESDVSHNPRSIANIDGANDNGVSLFRPRRNIIESGNTSDQETLGGAMVWSSSPDELSLIDEVMSPVEEEDEEDAFELPPLRSSTRRDSFVSQTSTVVHNTSRYFDDTSSDLPEVSGSPAIRRTRLREAIFPGHGASPPSSPPEAHRNTREGSMALLDSPMITAIPEDEEFLKSSIDGSFFDDYDDSFSMELSGGVFRRESMGDQRLREQIYQIIESIPAKIKLSAETPTINLNPPDLQLPRLKKKPSREPVKRSTSGLSNRTVTPSFTLSPAKNTRQPRQRGQQPIKVYHLSRSNGDAPIKLFIRCVGENGERVMVRVGGGWADLSEYLKEYVSHHGSRSNGKEKAAKVEVRGLSRASTMPIGSSPPSRPPSVAGDRSSMSPLSIRKTRRGSEALPRILRPKTPVNSGLSTEGTPPSNGSAQSERPGSQLSWVEDESSSLGLAGPRAKKIEMSEENKAWVESVKEKVRMVSGERRAMTTPLDDHRNKFGELGKVGGTKRLFRRT